MALILGCMLEGGFTASHAVNPAPFAVPNDRIFDQRYAASAPAWAGSSGSAVVFVDWRVRDAAVLLDGVTAGTQIVYLRPKRDALEQIADYLADHAQVGSVEIIAHGNAGQLLLGPGVLDSAALKARAPTLGLIGERLPRGADILVYACNTAANPQGVAFVNTLARLTGHAVAASSNVTGVDGDWNLEVTSGDVTHAPVLSARAQAAYKNDLTATPVTSSLDDGSNGTLRYAIAHAGAGDVLYFNGSAGTITLTQGALAINQNLTIQSDAAGDGASGSQVTIDANYASRVLTIGSGANVNLIGLTLEHGLLSGNGGNGESVGASSMGAGIANAGNLTLTNSNVALNYSTGGGGGGGGAALNEGFGGGGGSGAHSTGGGTSGVATGQFSYNPVAGSGGSGGTAQGTYGGHGGTAAGGGLGGSNGGGFYAGGGNGGSASGSVTIGGGGGGTGFDASGGAGGNAAGGIYNTGKLYVVGTSAITHNYAAGGGGGGGGGSGNVSGAGGQAVGGIWNTSGGTVKMTAAAYTAMGSTNHAGSGAGAAAFNLGAAGATPTTYGTINNGTGSISLNYQPAASVSSVAVPSNGTYHTGQALDFSVTFTGNVTVSGIPEIALTLDTGGTVEATYVSGSGSSTLNFAYTIVAGEQDTTGITVGALTLNGGTIKDGGSNDAVLTLNGLPSTAGVDVQAILPTVVSINISGSSPTNGASEAFAVTFSEAVTGVVAGDFTVSTSGTSDTGITSVTTSDNIHYTVTVGGVSGNGTLGLNLNSGTGITDTYGNVISGGHTGDQTYTIDQTAPTVSSIARAGTTPNNASTEIFTVTFSENVSGVDTGDFSLSTSGSVSGAIASVSGSGSSYTVTVNGVTGDGTLGLNLKGAGTGIADGAGNPITGGFTGQVYTIDHTAPIVSAITALGASPNNASSDQFQVVFSEPVIGVGAADFALTTTNTPGGTALTTGGIVSITTSDNIHYTVTIGSVAGDGTLRLDLKANSTGIIDASGNGATAAFTGGSVYVIEHTPPAVSSSVATGTNPNNASSDPFTVLFSEDVTGVDASDFTATTISGNVTAAGITVVPVNAYTYTVTLTGVTGDGVLRLDLNNSGTGIADAAGNAISGGYTAGDAYTIEHSVPVVTSVAVPASATYIAGQNLDFTVNFSEPVIVGGAPELGITLDTGGTVYAQYLGGSNTSAITFRFTVVGGESDTNGVTLDAAITMNGGSMTDVATNNAVPTLNSVASTAGVRVDSIAPTVSSVGVPVNGTYGAGQALAFNVTFSENVVVATGGGTPYIDLTLDVGGTVHAAYVAGSGSSQLTFAYTVAAGNDDMTGVALGSSIVLNGGTIKDAATNAAVLTLNSVASTGSVLVDAVPPTVTSINLGGSSPTKAASVSYTVTFGVPVNGVDASDFTLVGTGTASGVVSTVSGSGTTWTVVVGSVSGDGTLRLDLNNAGDPITDNFGNPLTAAHTGDQSYTIDHTPPSATAMTVPASGTYGIAQNMDFTVTFSEAVTVSGTPRIAITLDTGGTVYANYLSGSGSNTLTFRYAPTAGVQDLTGIVTDTSIDANSGTIEDAATNNATLAINAVEPSTAGVDVDAVQPVVTSVGVPANATYVAGQDLDFIVNLNKNVTVDTTGGTPYVTLTLDVGGTVDAQYVSGSGTSSLTFRYVVQNGNLDLNGVALGTALVLNGATIDDSLGNAVATGLNAVAPTTGVHVNAAATVSVSVSAGGNVTATTSPPSGSPTITACRSGSGGCTASYPTAEVVNLTLTPDANYILGTATGCGGSLSGNVFTTTALTADCTVAVSFKETTTVTLAATPNPIAQGQNATLTATVAGDPPTGAVTFCDGATSTDASCTGGTTLCAGVPLVPGTTNSKAVCVTSFSTLGQHNLSAYYAGDGSFTATATAPANVLAEAVVPYQQVPVPLLSRWATLLLGGLIGLVTFAGTRASRKK